MRLSINSVTLEYFGGKDAGSLLVEKHISACISFECCTFSSKLLRYSWFKSQKVRVIFLWIKENCKKSLYNFRYSWVLPEAYEKTTPVELQLMYCKFILDHASKFEDIYSEECQKFMKSYQVFKNFVTTHEEAKQQKLEHENPIQSEKEPLKLEGHHFLRNS